MKNTNTHFTITAPGPGQPAILDCSTFEGHLDRFEDALAEKWAAEFPGTTIEQLGVRAKADSGFERYWAMCTAIGFAVGARAGKAAATIEATIAASRATTATPKPAPTFEDAVRSQVARGASKVEAVATVMRDNPTAHLEYLRRGGGPLLDADPKPGVSKTFSAHTAIDKMEKKFSELVGEQVTKGKTKAEAIRIAMAANPKAYETYLTVGGQL